MEATDLPPLPSLKKRKGKSGKRGGNGMNRSRSFVAEMFHINGSNAYSNKKWSNNDMQLLQKMGISPKPEQNEKDHERAKLKISANLHPDLKQHAYEEQINSLSTELQQTKNNLMRAAEYGQHLIEENTNLESTVLELRNEAAEYIAQLCELREENEAIKVEMQGNEYSVNDYENKMVQYKMDTEDLNHKLMILTNQLTDIQLKYEMELNKSKLYKDENDKYQRNNHQLNEKHLAEIEDLRTKILVTQNTNHSLLMDKQELMGKNEKLLREKNLLEREYNELYQQYEVQVAAVSSQCNLNEAKFEISRRDDSRSRSGKREEMDEKMDEIMMKGQGGSHSDHDNDDDNNDHEYKSDPKSIEYGELLVECMHLFENIMDDQHIYSPMETMKGMDPDDDDNNIDCEIIRDLMESVQKKWKQERYDRYDRTEEVVQKRNINELRRSSKSAGSHLVETLDDYVVSHSMDDEQRHIMQIQEEEEEEEVAVIEQEENKSFGGGEDKGDTMDIYEADNEDLDNLANDINAIKPIDENQKKCVDQFLMRYSENNAWRKRDCENGKEYQLEIEFNENVTLENKKRNNISISGNLLQSLTNLIENIMGIDYASSSSSSYFSMCGWFCGKYNNKEEEESDNYSLHYLNILSTLDYNKKNREEIYWVIYQLLNIIYRYYNYINYQQNGQNGQNVEDMKGSNVKNDGNVSDSESISMVLTQSKSQYAELKPPPRKTPKTKKIKSKTKSVSKSKKGGTFSAITNDSSSSDYDSQR